MFWHPDRRDAPIRFQVRYAMEWQATELYAARNGQYGNIEIPVVAWTVTKPGEVYQPLLRLSDTEGPAQMQGLFDALWVVGFRPTKNGDRPEAVVAAKDAHLDDLRKIVTKLLDSA